MWIKTHKVQFAELQESRELRSTSSHLAPPWRVWKRENSWGRAQVDLGLHASDAAKDYRRNSRIWKQEKESEVAEADAVRNRAKP